MESIIKFNELDSNNVNLEYKKNKLLITYANTELYLYTPITYLPFGVNTTYSNHFIDISLSTDNNDIQIFSNQLLNLEKKFQEEYLIKRSLLNTNKTNFIFTSNIKRKNGFSKFLRSKIYKKNDDYDTEIYYENNIPLNNFQFDKLKESFCSFLLKITGIWEMNDKWGYNVRIVHIYINQIKELLNYSFLSDNEDDENNNNTNSSLDSIDIDDNVEMNSNKKNSIENADNNHNCLNRSNSKTIQDNIKSEVKKQIKKNMRSK